ncbi:MAG: lytic transglycosylase domain-containing protein [Bacteroidetes bacterium]|nr:lytic transglycosylase domain-containing protein [Bacteroidota bacterium]
MTVSVWILKLFREPSPLYKKTYVSLGAWLIIAILIKTLSFHPDLSFPDYSDSNFKVLGLNIPTNLEFAGERVPQNDYEIKESLEKEFFANKSWKNSSLALFVKARKWFPLIEPILKKEGVPDDFKYVAIIESHLSNVVSPVGASGFWQLMPITAQHYGLTVNSEIDERLDVEKATVVACKHFKDAYNYFNNWTLSAAAYNVGIGGIQNALKKQNTNNYYDLLLNEETGSFIYRILAYKTLLSNPTHFGVKNKLQKSGGFPAFKIVKVDSSITNLPAFAKHVNTNIIVLKTFNPWLIGEKLDNPEKKIYQFKIPKNKNIDLSVYFNDVFPQKSSTDTILAKPIETDSLKTVTDTLKK